MKRKGAEDITSACSDPMPKSRQKKFDRLPTAPPFDALVIGGGINGISTYRELALQGLKVLLVERNDFCSGCSSAPSRMIHGGLRYLENGEFHLVRESLHERDALLTNAPHLVMPLPTTVPIKSIFSGIMNGLMGFVTKRGRPSSRGVLVVKAGLMLYDIFTRNRRLLPKHVFLNRKETLARWPRLNPALRFSATYHDAWISHPERLGIEILKDCEQLGATAFNYAHVTRDGDSFAVEDLLTGKTYPIMAKTIVNATGAWLDATNRDLLQQGSKPKRFVEGTKGSHLIVANRQLSEALDGHMIYFENSDRRVCIMFPYLGNVLLGSTDLRVDSAGPVRCENEEIEYILTSLAEVFPDIKVTPDQIVYTYSGIRPLPQSDAGFTGRISRDHFTHRITGRPPVFCMVGGKWTTFRAFGEQTCDLVLAELKQSRTVGTSTMPIGGGKDFPTNQDGQEKLVAMLCENFGIDTKRAWHAVSHYGTTARTILEYCAQSVDDRQIAPGSPYSEAEIRYLVRTEYAQSPADILLRRTSIGITGGISTTAIETVIAIMALELGWDDGGIASQKANFITYLEEHHRVSTAMLDARNRRQ